MENKLEELKKLYNEGCLKLGDISYKIADLDRSIKSIDRKTEELRANKEAKTVEETEANQQYTELCLQRGDMNYRKIALEHDEKVLFDAMQDLNLEAAKLMQKESENAKA